jgi:2,3-bisphosphoglycerate-independent phosphoglycerate mutase
LNENTFPTNDKDLFDKIQTYVTNTQTLKQLAVTSDHGDPGLEDENASIQSYIISKMGQEYFDKVENFAELAARRGNSAELTDLANELGYPDLV